MSAKSAASMLGRMAPHQLPLNFNIAQALLDVHIEAGRGDKVAIYFQGNTITYGDLSAEVNKLGNLLRNDLKLARESRVALLLFDCPEFICSFLAVTKIGAVAVPMSTMLSPTDYQYMLNDMRAAVVIADRSFLDVIASIEDSLDYLQCILVVDERNESSTAIDGNEKYRILRYHENVPSQPDSLHAAPTHKDEAAFWLYTSGSTGKPKGVIHLHHDIYYAAFYLNQYFYDIDSDDLLYSASKLFFAYGLGNSFWMPFFSGASALLEKQRSTPAVIAQNIKTYRPTKIFAVPTIYKLVRDYLGENRAFLEAFQNVQRYYSAGEPLSKSLYDNWLELTGREILTVLGSTEALQGYVGAWPDMGSPGCLGKVIPGYDARIADEEGNPVKPHEKGVLMIRGDSIAAGYWHRHEESKKAFRGEWLYTGDMVYEAEDEILWYVGRNDEMFKIAGLWVSPTEIEEVLATHPSIQESAVIACEGDDGLVTMVAYIVCKGKVGGTAEIENSLQEFLKTRLSAHKCPRTMRVVDQLPRNSTGKLQRFILKERYNAEAQLKAEKRRLTA